MIASELKNSRKSAGHSAASFAKVLDTPYSTYRDWEDGRSPIPGAAAVAVRLLMERDRWATARAVDAAISKFDRDFPAGIVSEPEKEEDA